MTPAIALRSLSAFVFRCPLDTPVVTSFGTMRDRPMLLVRVEDHDGAHGWGEVWCNFPSVGVEHRARLVDAVLAPIALGAPAASAEDLFRRLTERTSVLALQSGEPGPFAQAIAGVDVAVWDLCARRAGVPLWRLLGGAAPRVRVYASGLNPDAPERLAVRRRDEGHRAFKLKVGFGADRDRANLAALRTALGDDATIMVDANQAWTLVQAREQARVLEGFRPAWLEEPLRADRPWSEWQALHDATSIPLAAGENLAGDAAFEAALRAGALAVLQPDVGKWGGLSALQPLLPRFRERRVRYCPHWLGGGIGLVASAHLLASDGGDGLLELDANPNPLRELTCGPLGRIADGAATLGDAPGLGVVPDLAALERWRIR